MAFCNSCGAKLELGAKFCNKCGGAISGPWLTSPPPAPAAPPATGKSAVKIVLIVIAVIAGIGVLGIAGFSYFVYHVAKSAHVTQEGGRVKVDSPIGSFSANDPEATVKELGVDVYPGAEVQKQGSASMTFGGIHTVTANFETADPLDKVCDFYKSRYPGATVSTSGASHCTIVSGDQTNEITINAESDGTTTKIQIANVTKNK